MPDARMILEQVEARMTELEATIEPLRAEYEQLKNVAATFSDQGRAPASRPARRPRRTAGRSGAPAAGAGAAGDGSRAQQAVRLITDQPGVTAAGLAQAMGISRNYLYRVLPKLQQAGAIVKRGNGYHLPSGPADG